MSLSIVPNRARLVLASSLLAGPWLQACSNAHGGGSSASTSDSATTANENALIEEGRETFRHDTFGDEAFWGGVLQLHQAVKGAANGGVGPGLSPTDALSLGLMVDSDALGASLRSQI